MVRWLSFGLCSTLLACLTLLGCHSPGARRAAPRAPLPVLEEDFALAFLVRDPEQQGPALPPERAEELQRGHAENLGRLARTGSLLLAGRFPEPRVEPRLREILILDVRRPAEAQELIATDPAVAAGGIAAEVHLWRTNSPLRALPALAEAMRLERTAGGDAAEPFEDRLYVLVLMRETASTPLLLAPLLEEQRVLFHGRFGGAYTGTSLWCLDETDPRAARARLEALAARAGVTTDFDTAWELHSWSATGALARLPGVQQEAGRAGSVRVTAERRPRFELGGSISTGIDLK